MSSVHVPPSTHLEQIAAITRSPGTHAPSCHARFCLQHSWQPPGAKRIDCPWKMSGMFKNVHKTWLLISFGLNPLGQISVRDLGWGTKGGIVLLGFAYRWKKELIQPTQLKLRHHRNTWFLEPAEWFPPGLALFDLGLLCACQHTKTVITQANAGQKFHSCSILGIGSCLQFCLMQMIHPMAKCIL